MSILARIKAIWGAQVHRALANVEDPRATLDYSLARLQAHMRQVNDSLVQVSAARRRLEAQRHTLTSTVARYDQQARTALQQGREDLARLALERKQAAQARVQELDTSIASLDEQLQALKTAQATLRTKIELFRSKKEELKAMYDSTRAQLRVQEALTGLSTDLADVGHAIQRAEERIAEMRVRAEAIEDLVLNGVLDDVLSVDKDVVDRELARLARSEAVEAELARLKDELRVSPDQNTPEAP